MVRDDQRLDGFASIAAAGRDGLIRSGGVDESGREFEIHFGESVLLTRELFRRHQIDPSQ
jgi:hypothetical protein